MADEQTGESSTPEEINALSDEALNARDFTRYQEIENARESGKSIPEASTPSTETPSDKTPASEPGTKETIQEPKKAKTGEDRKIELAAEIQVLLKQRAELQGKTETPGEKKADPPPAAVTPAVVVPKAESAKGAAPKRPSLADFTTLDEYDAATDAFISDLVAFKAGEIITARDTEREATATQKTRDAEWVKKVTAAKEEFSDFDEIALNPKTLLSPVTVQYLKTKTGTDEARVLYKLGENDGAEAKRILALDPIDQVEALGDIKRSLATPVKKEAPVIKKHTTAPPPATNLGGRDTEPNDAVDAALNSGDVKSYMDKANARDRKAASNR
jgi:hypothetical protein